MDGPNITALLAQPDTMAATPRLVASVVPG